MEALGHKYKVFSQINPTTKTDIEAELYKRYRGTMSAKDVSVEIGLKHHASYEKWLADVPYCLINNRKRYRCSDVAQKLYMSYHSM